MNFQITLGFAVPQAHILKVILTVVCDSLHNTHQGCGRNIELHTIRQVDLQVSVMLATVLSEFTNRKYMKNNSTTLSFCTANCCS